MVTVDSPGRLLIGGSWRGGQDEETFEIIEPATSQVMATAAVASPADVDAAVSPPASGRRCSTASRS